jgi:hypothetical protein
LIFSVLLLGIFLFRSNLVVLFLLLSVFLLLLVFNLDFWADFLLFIILFFWGYLGDHVVILFQVIVE